PAVCCKGSPPLERKTNIPQCTASSKYTVLSFFTFPADEELRRKWIVTIPRDKFTVTPHTRVCSRHFKSEYIREPVSEKGRRLLKKGAVPLLFEWSNFSLPTPRPGLWERKERPAQEDDREDTPDDAPEVPMQHDYASAPDPAIVDLVLEENTSLRDENRLLRQQLERLTLKQRFGIHRFAASDKDIRFFTR
uniref:THAP domain-containing protein 1 n=1 Tax=Nothobranchius furzeri TaxID=105023 RepID=A0A8C6MHG4_NOTFU